MFWRAISSSLAWSIIFLAARRSGVAGGTTGETTTTPTTTTTTPAGECAAAPDCSLDHAEAACSAGTCVIDKCHLGFADCNGERLDGCEANLANDEDHCGKCDESCNGDKECKLGKCK